MRDYPQTLGVVILSFNEEIHIARAIQSVKSLAQQILVVDSGSMDNTVDIARKLGARVLYRQWIGHAEQLQWALDEGGLSTDWIMRLDADEFVDEALCDNIRRLIGSGNKEITGLLLLRRHIFMGRWIRHGLRYPVVLLRVWRRGAAVVEPRWMDEHIFLRYGRAVVARGRFVDENLKGIGEFVSKHNRYATLEAIELVLRSLSTERAEAHIALTSSPRMVVTRYLKENIYGSLPFWLSSPLYFVLRYFIFLGFLDGVEGLIYHFLQGFWYRFLVGAKVIELMRDIDITSPETVKEQLIKLTGVDLARMNS